MQECRNGRSRTRFSCSGKKEAKADACNSSGYFWIICAVTHSPVPSHILSLVSSIQSHHRQCYSVCICDELIQAFQFQSHDSHQISICDSPSPSRSNSLILSSVSSEASRQSISQLPGIGPCPSYTRLHDGPKAEEWRPFHCSNSRPSKFTVYADNPYITYTVTNL